MEVGTAGAEESMSAGKLQAKTAREMMRITDQGLRGSMYFIGAISLAFGAIVGIWMVRDEHLKIS